MKENSLGKRSIIGVGFEMRLVNDDMRLVNDE